MFKKSIIQLTFLIAITSIFSCQQGIDVETEKEAIKKAIQTQLDYVSTFDINGEDVWAHKPYVIRNNQCGWDSVSAYYQNLFPQYQDLQISESKGLNFDIHLNGNFAAVFHETEMIGKRNGEDWNHKSKDLKYLEKIDGNCKVIVQFGL